MASCSLRREGRVFVLTLHGDGEHRLNPAFMDSIISLLEPLNNNREASALITTNEGKFFSNGLDTAWSDVDPDSRFPAMGRKLQELLHTMLNLRMPTIAAVCGHASAGGFIFALAHDYILMRKDRGFLYMSEIDVRILIPPGPMEIIKHKMPPKAFKDTVLGGVKHTADMALAAGIIDSVHKDSKETLNAALKRASNFVGRNWNQSFYLAMRQAVYSKAFEEFEVASKSLVAKL